MGIHGLLPFVKPASSEKHISNFKGQTVAIDSYCWLHRGAFGCAEKIVKGETTNSYVTYCMKYIDMLLTFKIKPVMVFDGRHLPAKLLTEKRRRESRSAAKKKAIQCLKLGKIAEARSNFQKCVDITPEMALSLIKECRKRAIDCIVAPYEADAQLAYLNITNMVDFIISEDSDLIPFGCRKVMFKLDLSGTGILVEGDKLHLATQERPDSFSLDRFRYMCILSGCDYLESLPGIGLKKALKFLKRIPNSDIYNNIAKLSSSLNMQLTITSEYRDQFMIADATFRHQLVFDPIKRKLMPLTDPVSCGTKLEYCCNAGDMLDNDVAFQIAIGNLEPFTLKVLDTWCPETALKRCVNPVNSIWSKSYRLVSHTKQQMKSSNVNCTNLNVDYKMPEQVQLIKEDKSAENLIAMYSTKEPPAKRICLRESVEEKLEEIADENINTSPILSGRREFINPFKKSRLKQSDIKEKSKVIHRLFSEEHINNSVDGNSSYNTNVDPRTIATAESRIVQTGINVNSPVVKGDEKTAKKNDNEVVVVVAGQAVVVSKFFCKQKASLQTDLFTNNKESTENSDTMLFPCSQNSISSSLGTNSNSDNFPKEQCSTNSQENKQVDSHLLKNEEESDHSSQGSQSKQTLDIHTAILMSKKDQTKTCRQPGLRKKLSKTLKPAKNQQTLLSMFGFSKK